MANYDALGYDAGKLKKVGASDNLESAGGLVIKDDGYIGSASAPNSIQIAASGDVTIPNDLAITGDFTVNGTTATVNQTNLDVSDNIIGLNRGALSNANDSGLIIERGSTGDNAAILWDESEDMFVLGTTTATPSSTGDLSVTTAYLSVTGVKGNLVGDVYASNLTSKVLEAGSDGTDATFTGAVTGTVSDISNHDTDSLSEGTSNLYHTSERVQDVVGAQLVTNGTHSLISAAYDDTGDGAIDLTVTDDLSLYDNSNSAFITASSTDTLTNKTFDADATGNSISNLAVDNFAAAAIVVQSEGIGANNNDTTLPTTAAVKAFVDSATAAEIELNVNAASAITLGEFVGFFTSGSTFGLHPLESGFTAEVVGMAAGNINANSPVSVLKEGIVTQIDDVTGVTGASDRGSRVYLLGDSGTGQSLTLTPPTSGAVVQVGILLDHTSTAMKMLLKIQHIMDN